MNQLAIHTITTKPWSTEDCLKHYAAAGVGGITFWRYSFEGRNPETVGRQAREAGLEVVSVARGGFFTQSDWEDDNKRAIDETAACGAPSLVLVCGSTPGVPLADSRRRITERIGQILPYAQAAGVTLAIEPLHPMYAADRSAITTADQAHEVIEQLGHPQHLGIAFDVYHTWWDPNLEEAVGIAGRTDRLTSFHICDWKVATTDLLNDRGLMGEGCIDLRYHRKMVEAAGFDGFHEVEIFSNHWWSMDQAEYLRRIVEAYRTYVLLPEKGGSVEEDSD